MTAAAPRGKMKNTSPASLAEVEMAIARVGVAVVVVGAPVIASIVPVEVSRPVAYKAGSGFR